MAEYAAIVLSAGSGTRMNSEIPKQYMNMNGKPVIFYSLKAFQDSEISQIVLVCGKDDITFCQNEIVKKYQLTKVTAVVPGGKERYDSVYEGIKAIRNADYVLIHDGARPMVDQSMIRRSMEAVLTEQACVAAMPVKDTIKVVDETGHVDYTPDRKLLWQIQTPQTFAYSMIREAYEAIYKELECGEDVPSITDDAMVVEHALGQKIRLIEGSYENIKVTTPEDIEIVKMFLDKKENNKELVLES